MLVCQHFKKSYEKTGPSVRYVLDFWCCEFNVICSNNNNSKLRELNGFQQTTVKKSN